MGAKSWVYLLSRCPWVDWKLGTPLGRNSDAMLTTVSFSLPGVEHCWPSPLKGLQCKLEWGIHCSLGWRAFSPNIEQNLFFSKIKLALEILRKAWQGESETLVACRLWIVLFLVLWRDCIVLADNWSNNPGHSGIALSGAPSITGFQLYFVLYRILFTHNICTVPYYTQAHIKRYHTISKPKPITDLPHNVHNISPPRIIGHTWLMSISWGLFSSDALLGSPSSKHEHWQPKAW